MPTKTTTLAWSAFTFFLILGVGAWYAIGATYRDAEATQLLETLSDTGLYLGSAGAGASATILALMLTLLGFVRKIDVDFDQVVNGHIDRISKFATASLMLSLLLLLLLAFPIGDFQQMPQSWFGVLFHLVFAAMTLVIAFIALTVATLYATVQAVIGGVADAVEDEQED
ncbi:hypothetical protein [Sphingomicrobium aestuariivivum]|uniref:hypothetical protein n=1 Tax=Sphingomicrobium aestuariivivum TaxID=1582356 RepID=UPI001FD717B2|nr:hypothetical protein [Sphingomicrobium aestuariivivum]MCJ8190909.1 hypothetical protein [Sphingomicrobium aestuariivivum]